MSHSLILGTTECGKTTVAKILCSQYKAKNIASLVLDPLNDPEWDADFQTTNSEKFLAFAKRARSCALFVDESSMSIGKHNVQMEWCTTTARHWGHKSHLICHRAQQLSPTIRNMCGILYLFRVSFGDAKLMAEEFSEIGLEKANQLNKFEFFFCSRFAKPIKMRVNPSSKTIHIIN